MQKNVEIVIKEGISIDHHNFTFGRGFRRFMFQSNKKVAHAPSKTKFVPLEISPGAQVAPLHIDHDDGGKGNIKVYLTTYNGINGIKNISTLQLGGMHRLKRGKSCLTESMLSSFLRPP